MSRAQVMLATVASRLRVMATARSMRDAFDGVEAYCMFLGYPRSGHTLVGALLNAHPAAVIAHELDALYYIGQGAHRDRLFALLLERDRQFSERGNEWTGYSYAVPNQWQGRHDRLRVIGDKKGGMSTLRLLDAPGLLDDLEERVGVPVYYIHVVRNPFNNIATMSLRSDDSLAKSADLFLERAELIGQLIASPRGARIKTIHHESVVAAAADTLRDLWDFIGVPADAEYLRDCASIVFSSPSMSRHKVEWPAGLRAAIADRMDSISFLERYSLEE